jgi:hypothetical protein
VKLGSGLPIHIYKGINDCGIFMIFYRAINIWRIYMRIYGKTRKNTSA